MPEYRISQLANRAGLRPSALRFYEQAGLLPAQRSASGYRLYGEDAVERLGFISSGKHLGLPLTEIRELLEVWEDGLCVDVRRRPMLLARIEATEQRSAELAAFTARLRQALAEIDGPPRPGRCDPGCGFLEPHHDPTPVPITLSRPEPQSGPEACTLTGPAQAERLHQWRQLLARTQHREAIDGGLRILLPATLTGPAAELAAAEQRCCPFFDFTLHLAGGGLQLEVRAPNHATPLLADVFGTPG